VQRNVELLLKGSYASKVAECKNTQTYPLIHSPTLPHPLRALSSLNRPQSNPLPALPSLNPTPEGFSLSEKKGHTLTYSQSPAVGALPFLSAPLILFRGVDATRKRTFNILFRMR
jgi:hypothetical protein